MLEKYITGTGQHVMVHTADKCAGHHCCIHNPSDNHMKGWPTHWRQDRGMMERLCEHAVGHPDFDDSRYHADDTSFSIHGCDGCCRYDTEIEGLPARWYEGAYAVSSNGEVWSYWRTKGPKHDNQCEIRKDLPPNKLTPRKNDKGYLRVQLTVAGRLQEEYVHRLCWIVWKGPIVGEMQVRHLDGNPDNNGIYNLSIGTQEENEADKTRRGTRLEGDDRPNSKPTEAKLKEAAGLWSSGFSLSEIVRKLGLPVCASALHYRLVRAGAKHVKRGK